MALLKIAQGQISKLNSTTFEAERVLERQDLQRFLREHIDLISPDTLVISEEFGEWEGARRRIDLLAIDSNANLVVIELKRDETGAHMELQALRYAAMISKLTFERVVSIYQKHLKDVGRDDELEKAEEKIGEFLDSTSMSEFPRDVRIVLASAEFSKELTTSVMWLNEKGLDIRCVRLKPYRDDAEIFVEVQQVIPLPEAEDYLVKVREQAEERRAVARQSKDFSKYQFEGKKYGKNGLVFAVVARYLESYPSTNFEALKGIFPNSLQGRSKGSAVFVRAEEARRVLEETTYARHFLKDEEVMKTGDGITIAVSNQWGIDNIGPFVENSKKLGFNIEKLSTP